MDDNTRKILTPSLNVLLFKSTPGGDMSKATDDAAEENDKFLIHLRKAGYHANLVPVLAFEFCNLEKLWVALGNVELYAGLILTSPRCVQSITEAAEAQGSKSGLLWSELRKIWSQKKLYCVGPATLEATKELFHIDGDNSNISQSEDGNAESLGRLITKEHLDDKPLLYPCGSLKTGTLPDLLEKSEIAFELLTVYKTVPNPQLEESLRKIHSSESKQNSEVYVFFSPSGLKFCQPYLDFNSCCKVVAIGPTTKKTLEEAEICSVTDMYQCNEPTPGGLEDVLVTIEQDLA